MSQRKKKGRGKERESEGKESCGGDTKIQKQGLLKRPISRLLRGTVCSGTAKCQAGLKRGKVPRWEEKLREKSRLE